MFALQSKNRHGFDNSVTHIYHKMSSLALEQLTMVMPMTHVRNHASILIAVASLATIFFGQASLYSQDLNTIWLIQRAAGDTLSNCSLDSVSLTTLWFREDSTAKSIALDSIAFLWTPGKTHPVRAILIGAAAGGVLGYLLAPGPSEETESIEFAGYTSYGTITQPAPTALYVCMGAGLGGLLGRLIDNSMSGQKYVDLNQMDRRAKANKLLPLIQGTP